MDYPRAAWNTWTQNHN